MRTWTALILWHTPPPYGPETRQHYILITLPTETRRKPGLLPQRDAYDFAEKALRRRLRRKGIDPDAGIFTRKEFRLVRLPTAPKAS